MIRVQMLSVLFALAIIISLFLVSGAYQNLTDFCFPDTVKECVL